MEKKRREGVSEKKVLMCFQKITMCTFDMYLFKVIVCRLVLKKVQVIVPKAKSISVPSLLHIEREAELSTGSIEASF